MPADSQIDPQSVPHSRIASSDSLGQSQESSLDKLQAAHSGDRVLTGAVTERCTVHRYGTPVNRAAAPGDSLLISGGRNSTRTPSSGRFSMRAGVACEDAVLDGAPDRMDAQKTNAGPVNSAMLLPQERSVLRQANKQARIILVDHEPLSVIRICQHLKEAGYTQLITTSSAANALELIRSERPDVVLLDINTPEISGMEILYAMGMDPDLQSVPVLVLMAVADSVVRRKALALGASDFLDKPVDADELLPRIRNATILKHHFDMVAGESAHPGQYVERRVRQLEATHQQLILTLARAAEHREHETGNHVLRVGRYSAIIAAELGYSRGQLAMLEQAAQLHDVGKIGIPDSILFKTGRFDPDEYELVQKHCVLGRQIIEPISRRNSAILQSHTRRGESLLHFRSSPMLMLAAKIAQTHHEKWDGSGYPLGLSGTDIPLEGRIVSVADVFDTLSGSRSYKKQFSREQCFDILEASRGRHFDPRVLDAFFRRSREIVDTQLQLMDEVRPVTPEEFVTVETPENPI